MSQTSSSATLESSQGFDGDLNSLKMSQALFNPFPRLRAQARAEIRKESPFTPDQWKALDASVKNPKTVGSSASESRGPMHAMAASTIEANRKIVQKLSELEADTNLQPDTWTDEMNGILEEHDAEPTIVDRLLSDGYGSQTNLSRYIWTYDLVGSNMEAAVSKNGRRTAAQDRPNYGTAGIPLPIIHADYEVDSREYQNSQAHGDDLNDRIGSDASLAVRRKEADVVVGGWNGNIRSNGQVFTLNGMTSDTPSVISGTATGAFGDSTQIFDTLDKAIRSLMTQDADDPNTEAPSPVEEGMYAFVGTQVYAEIMLGEYESNATDESVMERWERKYPYVDLIHLPRLDPGEVVFMVQNTRYFDIVVAQGLTNLNWQIEGGMALRNKVMSSRVPVVKEQPDPIYGLVHYTGALG